MATAMKFYTENDDNSTAITDTILESGQSFTIGTTGANVTFVVTSVDLKMFRIF